MAQSANARWWFRECCVALEECDDDMWELLPVTDLVSDKPCSITKTLDVFNHDREVPEVLDWDEAVMIRAAILQKFLNSMPGKLTLSESAVKRVGLPLPDANAPMQLNPPIADNAEPETPAGMFDESLVLGFWLWVNYNETSFGIMCCQRCRWFQPGWCWWTTHISPGQQEQEKHGGG